MCYTCGAGNRAHGQRLKRVPPWHGGRRFCDWGSGSQAVHADSDGRIDRFISAAGSKAPALTLKLHELMPGEPYLLGMFLTGAYQEVRSFRPALTCLTWYSAVTINRARQLRILTVRLCRCSSRGHAVLGPQDASGWYAFCLQVSGRGNHCLQPCKACAVTVPCAACRSWVRPTTCLALSMW